MIRRPYGLLFGSIALLLVVCGLVAGLFYYRLIRPGPHDVAQTVIIERGSGPGQIAHRLKEQGLVDDTADVQIFRLASRLLRTDRHLRAGEFAIPAQASIYDILTILRYAAPVLRRLTIPEGLSSREIVRLLREADGLHGTVTDIPDEGSLLPETYYFNYGDSRHAILQRMHRAQQERLEVLWQNRADDLPFSTMDEAVILASIVEKETGIAQERPLVASVFINRLKRGMRLQSDPTVIYGITAGEPLGRPIKKSELSQETAFNTYKINGLPPSPIANPGVDALQAVLNPPQTDYLYFVADGSGGHAFARTLTDHNRNVMRWRALRASQPVGDKDIISTETDEAGHR